MLRMNRCVCEEGTSHSGELQSGGKSFLRQFAKPGNYNLTLRDKDRLNSRRVTDAVSGTTARLAKWYVVVGNKPYQPG